MLYVVDLSVLLSVRTAYQASVPGVKIVRFLCVECIVAETPCTSCSVVHEFSCLLCIQGGHCICRAFLARLVSVSGFSVKSAILELVYLKMLYIGPR